MNKNQSGEIDLGKALGIFWDDKWLIILSTFIFVFVGAVYAILAPSVYTANATVQVEEKYTGGALKELSTIFERESSAMAEISVLKSRLILSKTVEDLNLTTQIQPIYSIPFFSKGFSKLTKSIPEATVSRFVPANEDFEEVILEIGANNTEYRLITKSDQVLLQGKVGEKYKNKYVEIEVTSLKGNPGSHLLLSKIDEMTAIVDLQKNISANEKGKQTGIIELQLNGESREYIRNILRSMTENYLQQSAVRNSSEAEKSLYFLQDRLPKIKDQLSNAENALNEYRQKNASVDLGLEAESMLEKLVKLEGDLNTLTIKESEISQRYTRRHPAYVALLEQRKVLQDEKERLTKQMETLPQTQKDIVRLTRDFEVEQQIYMQLSNKMQELDVVKAGAVGNVRILDQAQVLPIPVAPRKLVILVFSAILGFMLSCAAIIVKSLVQKGIKNVSEITEAGLVTYAVIPHSEQETKLQQESETTNRHSLLSKHYPDDLSIEALRGLRTGLQFAMRKAKNNLVMLSGVSQGVGKTFISTNLANVLAQAGQKVLLIDADLRRGSLHYALDIENTLGLSDLLSQNIPSAQAVKTSSYQFDVITRGTLPPNPSELLSSARCMMLLDWASEHYDVVIAVTPPILAVTDASVVGQYVGSAFLIGRFEKTGYKEIEVSRQRFENTGIELSGFIFNDMKPRASNRGDYFTSHYR